MYLAGSILLIYCVLKIVGTLISDILLAWLDPRIRIEEG
jgi:peptide/nickel transport system permease protein